MKLSDFEKEVLNMIKGLTETLSKALDRIEALEKVTRNYNSNGYDYKSEDDS